MTSGQSAKWVGSLLISMVLALGCEVKTITQQPASRAQSESTTSSKRLNRASNGTGSSTLNGSRATTRSTTPPTAVPLKEKIDIGRSGIETELPGSERIFSVDLDGDGFDEVLGASGASLWAYAIEKSGPRKLWSAEGSGVVHRIAVGQVDGLRKIFVARGIGRGYLKAPLSVQIVDPKSGQAKELWRHNGVRNEPAHLSVSDVDSDGSPDIAFAYYIDKYHVVTRHMNAAGKGEDQGRLRMASTRVYGDLNGDGKNDEVIARVYGDARGLPGDIKMNLGDGLLTVTTDNGVRGLTIARVRGLPTSVYFADGWRANYGKEAKAQVKRLHWTGAGPKIEPVGQSSDEFTFFQLWAQDVDGDGSDEIIARGNKHLSLFAFRQGKWVRRVLASFEPVINVAFGRHIDGVWRAIVPGKQSSRMIEAPIKGLTH